MHELLHESIKEALATLGLPSINFVVEYPDNSEHGDYSTNVALVLAKQLGEKPRDVAEKIKEALSSAGLEHVASITIAGAGFINFKLREEYFANVVEQIVKEGDDYGRDFAREIPPQKVMVEYTDPNPFKVFHIGHLMSNAVGESISRLIEFAGANVLRANYQGDVGLHVATAIWGWQHLFSRAPSDNAPLADRINFLGRAYAHASRQLENPPVKAEVEIINKKIYDRSDDKINELYDKGREWSLLAFEDVYKKLGTNFDRYFFESESGKDGIVITKGHPDIFVQSEGAIVFPGDKYDSTLHTRVFINKEGLPTYEAKELGLNIKKFKEEKLDQSIIITGNEINDYFRVLLKALSLIDAEVAQKTKHLSHGMLRLPYGKMSSRTGDVITGEALLASVEELARNKMESSTHLSKEEQGSVATDIAVGAIKYSILRQAIGKDIIFDFDKSLSFEGDSGPYLQYTFARTQSLLAKGREAGLTNPLAVRPPMEAAMLPVARLLERFPSEISRALAEYAPHRMCTYLIELASAFNAYYANNKIIDLENKEQSQNRLALTASVGQLLKSGLWLLGIRAPERM